ncbi:LacI family DNA-binding transcriptional regulator [Kineococcus sp. NPDC059986]|uniref:LacI family DNA-binding transcriptional regulator n=1 Tax=Kineococcus sp. NPDC059986 TaxID=3155538 RepID=UPI00344F31C1
MSTAVPTILDVAARAGVSKSVVSRVLTGAPGVAASTRERVQTAATELGYVANAMAQGMVARRTHTLGAFVRDAATPFYGHLLTALQERASAVGYRIVTATGSGTFPVSEERRALETLVSLRVEGLLVCSGALPVEDVLPLAARVPTVVAGRPETSPALSSVFCDERGGGRALADHVHALGHRRVVVLTLEPRTSLTLSPRSHAMADRLRELGVTVRAVRAEDHRDARLDGVGEVVETALADRATCLMTASDRYAVAALEALQQRGMRAPEDLSVTGYDGIGDLAGPLLGLTSWRQPLDVVGALAVDEVAAAIDARAAGTPVPTRHRAVDGSLLVGRTAGRP